MNINYLYRDTLIQHFERKKARNVRYSLRAFARDLDISVSRLSDVFNGKKNPSMAMATHIATQLGLSAFQQELFITSVQFEKEKVPARKKDLKKKFETLYDKAKSYCPLERFEQISEWLDHAICIALSISVSAPQTPEELADLLKVDISEVTTSLKKLIDREEIFETAKGWRVAGKSRIHIDEKPSAMVNKFQAQILKKAIVSLDEDSLEARDFTSIIFRMNSHDVPLMKKRLAEMHDQLISEFGHSKDSDSVYDLSFILFPISKQR